MRAILSIIAMLSTGLLIGGLLMTIAHATGLMPATPTPIIRIVHTDSGCRV